MNSNKKGQSQVEKMEDIYRRGLSREAKKRGMSVERKLELSHMLRQEQEYNRLQMDKREALVYGRPAGGKKRYNELLKSGYGRTSMLQAAEDEDAETEAAWQKIEARNRLSFVTRGFVSVLLFMIVLLMRFSGLKLYGVDYQNLVDSLKNEEFVNGIDFEAIMPYTEDKSISQGEE